MDITYSELYRKFNEKFFLDYHLTEKKTTYTAWTSWEEENYIKYKYLKSTKKPNFAVVLWRVFQQSWFQLEANISFTTLVTVDTKWRVFQYKIVNNILFVNKMLFTISKLESPLCSFCKAEDKACIHLFYRCRKTSILWRQLQ